MSEVGIGDIDLDGVIEIITSEHQGPLRVYEYKNDNFILQYMNSFQDIIYSDIEVIDIDNDHYPEIIAGTGNYDSSTYPITLFEWDGTKLVDTIINEFPWAQFRMRKGDIDNDGFEEVVNVLNGGSIVIIE